jgi:hypothetical protein
MSWSAEAGAVPAGFFSHCVDLIGKQEALQLEALVGKPRRMVSG